MISSNSGSTGRLPGLNGLRAIAASLVLFGHTYEIAGAFGIEEAHRTWADHAVGADMVNLFFVISGFIITYVLLREKIKTGTIDLKSFYIKRTLRIWPLYFFVLALVYVFSQYMQFYAPYKPLSGLSVVFLSVFAANFNNSFFYLPVSTLRHYWSLSVEEQFYIFWPYLFKRFSPLVVTFLVIALFIVTRNFSAIMTSHFPHSHFWKPAFRILNLSRFGSMAIGCSGAFLLDKIKRRSAQFFRKSIQAAAWLVFAASVLFRFHIPFVHFEVMAVLYLYLILSVTTSSHPLLTLEHRFLNKTGEISYGLYMYHFPLIPLVILGLQKIGWWGFFSEYHQVPLVVLSFLATYLVASVSYRYIELPFLRLKPAGKEPDGRVQGFLRLKRISAKALRK